jgi:hypothetical protein
MDAPSNVIIIPGGNILEAEETVICHQCNCVSTSGKGLAKIIFDNFPKANVYKNRIDHDIPGTNRIIKTEGKTIVNMFSQFNPGKPYGTDSKTARLNWFVSCLNAIKVDPGDKIAMPYLIGCDLAGGNWKKYYVALSTWAELNNITVVLYDINNKGV